ncbi:MAG TPA: PEP-CTERM sorting domain-containing protein [Stellaceae bacterium]|nr:PEP-CTERM sorting domain-containing protein [Stellaceae bacterium]
MLGVGSIFGACSHSGDGVVGSGTLITSDAIDPTAPLAGAYDILSISGTVNGEAITGLLGTVGPAAYSPDGYFIYDNDFYAAGSASAAGGYFDDDGLLFTTSTGSYNLFYDGISYRYWADDGSGVAVAFSTVDPPPPVPEPSSGVLFASGMTGLLFASRRKARPATRRTL